MKKPPPFPTRDEAEAIVWAFGVYTREDMWTLAFDNDVVRERKRGPSHAHRVAGLCSVLLAADGWTPTGLRAPSLPRAWEPREPGDDSDPDEGLVPLGDVLHAIRLGLIELPAEPEPAPQQEADPDENDDAGETSRETGLQVIVELGHKVNVEMKEVEERIALCIALDIADELPAARNRLSALTQERDALRREWRVRSKRVQ